jgi:hypothetical protein
MRILNWALVLATLACLALLAGYFVPALIAAASGGLPFDLRADGYDLVEARAYLATLSPAGTALYLGVARLTDTAFPILLTLTLCLPLRGRGQLWFLPALAYGIFDLAENVAVARLLRLGMDVEAGPVGVASGFTQAKFVALAVAVLLALIACWQAWRKR